MSGGIETASVPTSARGYEHTSPSDTGPARPAAPAHPSAPGRISRPDLSTFLLGLTVLVVAANLRPAITAVGSVIGHIAADTGLPTASLGLLGAVPLLAFAVVSPLVHLVSVRLGTERAVFFAVIVLIAGTVIRSLPGLQANLWIGTAILGAAIAVCNVLVPSIVKRDFPNNIAVMTGAYSAVISAFAALASGLAVPLSEWGGWRLGIGVWAVLSVVSAIVWIPRLRHRRPVAPVVTGSSTSTTGSMWTSPVAWHVTFFMGLQSTSFYLLITWLPEIEEHGGTAIAVAGWHLFAFQIIGIAGGLGITAFMGRRADQRLVGVLVSVLMICAMIGLLLAPQLVILWVLIGGLSCGSSLVVALTLVGLRSRTASDATRLSGMVQGVGYLLAAFGPIGSGLLIDATGWWSAPLVLVIGIASIQLVFAMLAGRDRYTHPEPIAVKEA
ncbi:CynX/NimT family MFS transporter [Plantibacter sp. Mn2098]|uniref:CynX/NimT family MFS transporter n=1 Tax=Plantibacter sp. Mn2098 TaxID=3395266 RepID=UPI003BC99955